MKPARLRPQAKLDRESEVRYYRKEASGRVAEKLVFATEDALDQLEQQPAMGSPTMGMLLGIPALRTWRVSGFPLLWFYFERENHLDVIRLLGERQDIAAILAGGGPQVAHEPEAAYDAQPGVTAL